MKRTKSKLDLNKLQEQFNNLLDNLTAEKIASWKQNDMKLQEEKLLNGESIEVESNPISYAPISCDTTDLFYRKFQAPVNYENAA